jgi:hypothetical protein
MALLESKQHADRDRQTSKGAFEMSTQRLVRG